MGKSGYRLKGKKIMNIEELKILAQNGMEKPDEVEEQLWEVAKKLANVTTIEAQPTAVTLFGDMGTTAVAMPSNGSAFSLDDMEGGSQTNGFISISNGIVKVGKNAVKFPEEGLKVKIIGSETRLGKGIRVTANNQTKYFTTYDGRVCRTGENWTDVVTKAPNIDPKSYVYNVFELVLELEQPLMASNGKTLVADAGERISYSNPPTAGRDMKNFADLCAKEKNLGLTKDDIPALLVKQEKTGKIANYQVLGFELV